VLYRFAEQGNYVAWGRRRHCGCAVRIIAGRVFAIRMFAGRLDPAAGFAVCLAAAAVEPQLRGFYETAYLFNAQRSRTVWCG